MKPYPLQLEISGPIALWARPDTMPNPVSYVAPTFSASKGIFEAILRWKSVNVRPARCEICASVQFHRYAFNYGVPLRKSGQIKDGTSCSLAHRMGEGGLCAQALINVCYRLHAEVDWNRGPNGEPAQSPDGFGALLGMQQHHAMTVLARIRLATAVRGNRHVRRCKRC